ncbi:Subtilisin-like protease [Hordeum vulgare]|nr:Subtilisin-like protease [Hordeum vulgare]
MADAHPNSDGPAVDQTRMAKKKKAKAPRKPRAKCTLEEIAKAPRKPRAKCTPEEIAKAPRKPRAKCTPEEIAKAPRKPRAKCTPEEIAKRKNRRAAVKDNAAARKFATERDAMEAARRKIEVEHKKAIVNKAHALLMLGICRPAGFSAAVVGPTNTGSSVTRSPHCKSPTSRTTGVSPGYPPPRHDAHTRFSGSPDVSVIAPSTPRPSAYIDLNVAPGSSSGGRASVEMQRKQAQPLLPQKDPRRQRQKYF